tara:strand:+ start:17459 stop:19147 length:1689 start_codon:yes stop_codon:yes gene_type:complete
MPLYSQHLLRKTTLLDGLWDFQFLGTAEEPEKRFPQNLTYTDKLPVPSAWDTFPAYAGKRGTAAYRTEFQVPANTTSFLRFRGTGMWNRVFVDGQEVETFALPYSQVDIQVPASASTTRELVVLNDNRYDTQRVPLQHNFYDFYAYGGIYRSVELHVVPALYFKNVRLLPGDVSTGKVSASFQFEGIESGEVPVEVSVDGSALESQTLTVSNGQATATVTVPDAKPWSAETPNLHTIRFATKDDDYICRVGFRTISTESGQVLINGKPTQLLGYCRHEAHPQTGPVIPLSQHVQDLQILKDLGCNFIRGSHYPQDPDFLDLCDELGFYVFEETLGWGNREPDFTNPAFHSGQLKQTELMIEKSINHPSVIMWGHLNEGASNKSYAVPLYRELYQLCHDLDPSRPVTFATMFPLDDLCLDFCDIVSVNTYPAWYAEDVEEVRPLDEINSRIDKIQGHLSSVEQDSKPFIISEIGAGAIYGWHDPHNAHWTEEYQADYLKTVCQRVVSDDKIAGVTLWQYCDGRTYSSGRALSRPRAFNNKGTLDEYRRPKMAYKAVKEVFRGD